MPPIVFLRRPLLGGLSLCLLAGAAAAQVPLTASAFGMGGAYMATARGTDSIFYNPANLVLPGSPDWSVAFPQISIGTEAMASGWMSARPCRRCPASP